MQKLFPLTCTLFFFCFYGCSGISTKVEDISSNTPEPEPIQCPPGTPKKRIAILVDGMLTNIAGPAAAPGIGKALVSQFMRAIHEKNQNCFVLTDRQLLDVILREAEAHESGVISGEEDHPLKKAGRIYGVQGFVVATVTSDQMVATTIDKASVLFPFFGGLTYGRQRVQSELTITIRYTETTRGSTTSIFEVKAASEFFVEGHIAEATSPRGGVEFAHETSQRAPIIGAPTWRALVTAAVRLRQHIAPPAAPLIKVADVVGENVYLRSGKTFPLKEGALLETFSVVKEIWDPDDPTILLETILGKSGQIVVVEVNENSSTARILNGSPMRHDFVRPIEAVAKQDDRTVENPLIKKDYRTEKPRSAPTPPPRAPLVRNPGRTPKPPTINRVGNSRERRGASITQVKMKSNGGKSAGVPRPSRPL